MERREDNETEEGLEDIFTFGSHAACLHELNLRCSSPNCLSLFVIVSVPLSAHVVFSPITFFQVVLLDVVRSRLRTRWNQEIQAPQFKSFIFIVIQFHR